MTTTFTDCQSFCPYLSCHVLIFIIVLHFPLMHSRITWKASAHSSPYRTLTIWVLHTHTCIE